MLIAIAGLAFLSWKRLGVLGGDDTSSLLNLESPFSLKSALKFGLLLIVIQVGGVFGQQMFGQLGVYVTSLIGSLFSSSSAVAAVAVLAARGTIAMQVAGNCAVIASLTGVVVNLPLVSGLGNCRLVRKLTWSVMVVAIAGMLGVFLQTAFISGR